MFGNKYYPIVLIPDSIATVIKARNDARERVSTRPSLGDRTAANLPANTDRIRKPDLPALATTKIWLPMPVLFLYLACLTAMLVCKQFALAALLTATFCFYCCWRASGLTKTARSSDLKTVLAGRTNATSNAEILSGDRPNATASTNPFERSKLTADNRPERTVDPSLPIERDIALQLKNIESKAILELKQISANAIAPLPQKAEAQEGATESFFLSHMKEFLPDLHTVQGVPFAIPGSKLRYSCDFTVAHQETGIAADIEIDEPYVATSSNYGKPHHCCDRPLDANRNRFFLQGNWMVIRFAEEQIALQPAACCKLIARVFAGVTGSEKIAAHLNSVPDLLPVKHWNSKTAGAMARHNYRQTYLSQAGINLVNSAPASDRNRRKKRHH
ncbi:MAG: hypothetical protein ACRC62_04440 [Microcoleus sp.]